MNHEDCLKLKHHDKPSGDRAKISEKPSDIISTGAGVCNLSC